MSTTPGFISLPAPKSESFIRANTAGVFQAEVLIVPVNTPVPAVSCGLFDIDNNRKYYFEARRNITAVKIRQETHLIFQTTAKDMIAPGMYRLVAEWKGGSHTVPILVPDRMEVAADVALPETPVAALPGVVESPAEDGTGAYRNRRKRQQ